MVWHWQHSVKNNYNKTGRNNYEDQYLHNHSSVKCAWNPDMTYHWCSITLTINLPRPIKHDQLPLAPAVRPKHLIVPHQPTALFLHHTHLTAVNPGSLWLSSAYHNDYEHPKHPALTDINTYHTSKQAAEGWWKVLLGNCCQADVRCSQAWVNAQRVI